MRRPTVDTAGAVVLLGLVVAADLALGSVVLLEFTMVPPLLSATLGHRRQTVWVAGASVLCAVLLGLPDDEFGTLAHLIQVAAVAIAAGFAVYAATVRENRDAQLTALALHDSLTGLVNRTVLTDRLTQLLARRTGDGVLAVMFLDLDGFKQVNDRFGHAAGDAVLQHVAARLQSVVRPADTVCRFAGDEFVVLCPDLPSALSAEQTAQRLLDALATPLVFGGGAFHVTASLGLSVADDQTQPLDLLRRADHAMYAAKAQGAGRWSRDDPAYDQTEIPSR